MAYPTINIGNKKIILLGGFEGRVALTKSCHHSQGSAVAERHAMWSRLVTSQVCGCLLHRWNWQGAMESGACRGSSIKVLRWARSTSHLWKGDTVVQYNDAQEALGTVPSSYRTRTLSWVTHPSIIRHSPSDTVRPFGPLPTPCQIM